MKNAFVPYVLIALKKKTNQSMSTLFGLWSVYVCIIRFPKNFQYEKNGNV